MQNLLLSLNTILLWIIFLKMYLKILTADKLCLIYLVYAVFIQIHKNFLNDHDLHIVHDCNDVHGYHHFLNTHEEHS